MTVVTIHEAKTNLSKLIARAEAGEEIVIARGRQPVAKITAVGAGEAEAKAPPATRRVAGMLKGKVNPLPDSFFFDPLPEEELRLWEGRGDEDID